jgi:hypothetical protein
MILPGQEASEDEVKRFYAEAKAAANLDRPRAGEKANRFRLFNTLPPAKRRVTTPSPSVLLGLPRF